MRIFDTHTPFLGASVREVIQIDGQAPRNTADLMQQSAPGHTQTPKRTIIGVDEPSPEWLRPEDERSISTTGNMSASPERYQEEVYAEDVREMVKTVPTAASEAGHQNIYSPTIPVKPVPPTPVYHDDDDYDYDQAQQSAAYTKAGFIPAALLSFIQKPAVAYALIGLSVAGVAYSALTLYMED